MLAKLQETALANGGTLEPDWGEQTQRQQQRRAPPHARKDGSSNSSNAEQAEWDAQNDGEPGPLGNEGGRRKERCVLEDFTQCSKSHLWKLMMSFYDRKGVESWSQVGRR